MAREKEINRPPHTAAKREKMPIGGMEAAQMWLTQNWKLAGALLIFILLVIAIYAVAVHVNRTIDASARKAFADAESTSEILSVLEANPAHALSDGARMNLAARYAKDKEYAKAAEQYSLVAASPRAELFLRSKAAINAAYMFEEAKSYNEALANLETVTQNPSVSAEQRSEALYTSARLNLLAGNNAKAAANLDELKSSGKTAWRDLGISLRRSVVKE